MHYESMHKDNAIRIGTEPVMTVAVDIVKALGDMDRVILYSSGTSIPHAVAVANIVTSSMLKGNSKVTKIILDTESSPGIGRMTSTIKIILDRI